MLTVDFERAGIGANVRVLDVGCGGGRHAFASLRCGAEVVACDANLAMVAEVAGTIVAMRDQGEITDAHALLLGADVLALPFADNAFDCVICCELLEHLPADRQAVVEVVRVLRPGGQMVISVPRAGPERLNWMLSRAYHEVEGGHVRIYRRRPLVDLLESCELRLLGSHHAHGLHSPYWWLRCLVGIDRADQRLVAAYHRVLVWDIVRRPGLTRFLDRLLNPLIGKSLVLYLEKMP